MLKELKVLKPPVWCDITPCTLKEAIAQMWSQAKTDKPLEDIKFVLACPMLCYVDLHDEVLKDQEEAPLDTLLYKLNISVVQLPNKEFGTDGWFLYSPDLDLAYYNEGA